MQENIVDFLDYLRHERRYSIHTITSYENDLGEFLKYLIQAYEVEEVVEVNHFQIRSWLTDLMKKGVANSSIKRKVSSLKSFYKYLLRGGKIGFNPMEKIVSPKVKKSLPKSIDKFSMNELIDSIPFDTRDIKGVMDRAILLVFYHTGIRRAELIGLRVSNVNLTNNSLKVLGKGGKERIVPFSEELGIEITRYLELDKGSRDSVFLFSNSKGEELYPKYVYNVIHNFLKKVGVASQKSPHVLRHSFATNLLNNGADINAIKELLGHASLNATQIYTQNSIEELKSIHKLAHPKS